MATESTATGWYYARRSAPDPVPTGPFSWAELFNLAQTGQLIRDDIVWHPAFPDWMPADQVAGLLPAAVERAAPVSSMPQLMRPAGAPASDAAGRGRERRLSWPLWAIPLLVVVLAGIGLGVYFGVIRGDGGPASSAGHASTSAVSGATATTMGVTTTTVDKYLGTWVQKSDSSTPSSIVITKTGSDYRIAAPAGGTIFLGTEPDASGRVSVITIMAGEEGLLAKQQGDSLVRGGDTITVTGEKLTWLSTSGDPLTFYFYRQDSQ